MRLRHRIQSLSTWSHQLLHIRLHHIKNHDEDSFMLTVFTESASPVQGVKFVLIQNDTKTKKMNSYHESTELGFGRKKQRGSCFWCRLKTRQERTDVRVCALLCSNQTTALLTQDVLFSFPSHSESTNTHSNCIDSFQKCSERWRTGLDIGPCSTSHTPHQIALL